MPHIHRISPSLPGRLSRPGALDSLRGAATARAAHGARPGWVRAGADQAWLQREQRYAGMRDGAVLLARMIDQMGGGAGSLPRGSFVSLDA